MQKYTEIILFSCPILIAGLSIIMLIYARVKKITDDRYLNFWRANFLLALSWLLPKASETVGSASRYILNGLHWAFSLLGLYFLWKVYKSEGFIEALEIRRHTAFTLALISMILAPITGLLALGLLFDSIINSKQNWPLMSAMAFSGTISVFLAIIGWRLFKIRTGWTGNLFTPYSLWFRLPGCLFLIVGLIKLAQRNLIGLGAIAMALALFALSCKTDNKVIKTN